jgi:putative flippase GtrA
MDLEALSARFEALPPTIQKLFKYSVASGTGVVVDVTVLAFCSAVLGFPEMTAHLIAVFTSSVPNYLINRRWTWQQSGKNRLWGEVVPFWVMSVMGLILSTAFVAYATDRWPDNTLAAIVANLSGFGTLWILKFLVLDRLMWKVVHDLQPDVDIDAAEAGLIGALDLDEAEEAAKARLVDDAADATAGANGGTSGANGGSAKTAKAEAPQP